VPPNDAGPPDSGSSSGGTDSGSSSGGTDSGSSSGGTDSGSSSGGPDASCALYGQICTTSADCCNGVPCTNGRCEYPIQ
jgi:hypothetical protein